LEVTVAQGYPLVDVLLAQQIVSSKNEFRRLVSEGAITKIDKGLSAQAGEKITDTESKALIGTYKIGKRRFIKINILP